MIDSIVVSILRAVAAWRKEYGDIYRLKFGPQESVVISGYKLVTEALHKHKRVFSKRAITRSYASLTQGHGKC